MKQDVVAARTYEPATWTALAAFALFAIFFVPIGHDQIWQLWLGREMLHGRGLYTDLVEVNPPLWFWIAVPQVALSELAGGGRCPCDTWSRHSSSSRSRCRFT